ncbi:EAL domain-containing protein [Massilia sp. ST3]|uniref:EAL domain-containing protein n=1 Tax=Massilia sp. ST3 TaxID=2824903 RepID=UPI001B820232|nr:EAL domain-containing protein [Massilia sp. ST3]MBQ5949186.1 EAL domain-containing protein [Massilia sp. ST3]
MKKPVVVLLTLLIACTAIGVPIWFAIAQSQRQGIETASDKALGYASDVLFRADDTGRQIMSGLGRLRAERGEAPCSPASIDLMRQIDLSSSYIQAVGYVAGDTLACSSIGGTHPLGKVDYLAGPGMRFRGNVGFPFAPDQSFMVVEIDHYAAIIHKDLPIDTANSEPDVSLAVLSLESPAPASQRGHVDPRWISRLGNASEVVFTDGGYVVALVRSAQFRSVALAAVPLRYVRDRSQDVALFLVPLGLVAGILLAWAIFYLARQQMALPAAVKAALRRGELFLEYQPVVDLRTGQWIGVEALVRWRRSTGELVQPELFIPIAEENGLIVRLTQAVLELVERDVGDFLAHHPDFHVGINVSPADFHDPGFHDNLKAALRRMRAAPGNLILEVTERGLLDPEVARTTSGSLRTSGFAVAIDDFGTGYSSLSYLESLALDYLKIDRSFIEAIGTGAPISQVVQHIIAMARDLKLCMIAEGVESQAQADFLRLRGVQYAQGWLFGKPMPFADVKAHFERMDMPAPAAAGA